MANIGYVRSLLGGLATQERRTFGDVFDYVLNNLRIGLPGHQKRAENLQLVQLNATTPGTAGEEFSIAHGIGAAPRVLFPCLDLHTVGAQLIPLQVSRAADENRVYFTSASTGATITVFVEAR